MDPLDVLRDADVELRPGLTPAEIDDVAAEVGVPLPAGLRSVLARTSGVAGPTEVDLSGRSMSYEDKDVFPAGLPIAGDGFGNFWVLDLTPDTDAPAPVFFACHDPPVVVYRSADLGSFLREFLHSPAREEDERVFRVWRENPGELSHADALAGDDELRAFAGALDERFTFVDLRSPAVGDGFSWGRFGPRTIVRRHGYARLFAYAAPEKKRGLFGRLFRS